MGDAASLSLRHRVIAMVMSLALSGCAGTLAPPSVTPRPWSEPEIEATSTLLALEDARDFDVETIASAVASPSPRIRARAALAAGRINPADARPFVRLLLQDEDSAVAATAAFVAGQVRDSMSVEILTSLLLTGTHRPTVAAEAAAALGKIGTDRAREVLRTFLATSDSTDFSRGRVTAEALTAAWRAGETSLSPFARWLGSADPEIRWRASYALTRGRHPEAYSALRTVVFDSVPLVRAIALRALSEPLVRAAGGSLPDALALVISSLEDPSYIVRIEAVRVLGSYADPDAIRALESRVDSGSPHERMVAIESLTRLGTAAKASAPFLRAKLEDPSTSSHVRERLVSALFAVQAEGLSALTDSLLLDPHWRVRAALAAALGPLRIEAVPVLRRLVRDDDPRVSAGALSALAESFDSTGLVGIRPLLLESLRATDVHVRAAALDGLSRLADPSTFPALLDAYGLAQRDIENAAALAAIEAIWALRSGGMNPERAFFARFGRHEDYLVRARAVEHFGDVAVRSWGAPHPIETGVGTETYRRLVSDWIARFPADSVRPRVLIETESGRIELEMFGDLAPIATSNFIDLVRIGYFNGQEWPRVVPNFVAQGGDPRGDTSGGPGYTIRDELNRVRFGAGTVGMALDGPDSGGSQFFITHSPQPHLDGGYTVFGRVLVGQEVVERILPGERILFVEVITEDVDS